MLHANRDRQVTITLDIDPPRPCGGGDSPEDRLWIDRRCLTEIPETGTP